MEVIFPIVFVVFFVMIIGIFVFSVIRGISQYSKNNNSPIVATHAVVIDKRCDYSSHSNADGTMHSSETLYLIFQLDTGSTMEFTVGGRVYRNIPSHEWGTLTFQGTRFLKFESVSGEIER